MRDRDYGAQAREIKGNGVLCVLDMHETEASNQVPPEASRTFRPAFLPQARQMSLRHPIILGFVIAISTGYLAVWLVCVAIDAIRRHA